MEQKKQELSQYKTTTLDVGKFRTVLPQIIASSGHFLIEYVMGIVLALPTIIIAVLIGAKDSNEDKALSFTKDTASLFGSTPMLSDFIGTLLSPLIADYVGRKRIMLLGTIPFIAGLLLLHYSSSIIVIFAAMNMLAFTNGIIEAGVLSYVSEICQPSIRGVILALGSTSITIGMVTVYLLGSLTDWRTAALICLAPAAIALVILLFTPESPIWLLSNDRKADAQKSLQWLRGWVPSENIEEELSKDEEYLRLATKCLNCEKKMQCNHSITIVEKLKSISERRNIAPLFIIVLMLICDYLMGLKAMKPFLVPILKAYGSPIDLGWATVGVGVATTAARVSSAVVMPSMGKRRITLLSLIGCGVCSILLAFYGFLYLPANWNSFSTPEDIILPKNPFPLIVFILYFFFGFCGISNLPWILISEFYPFKTRTMLTCVSASIGKLLSFATIQTYVIFEVNLSLPGVMCFYTVICILALVVVYFLMPNTEGFTLHEIEMFFSDKTRKITDTNIQKWAKRNRYETEFCHISNSRV